MLHDLSQNDRRCKKCGLDETDPRYAKGCEGVEQLQKTRGIVTPIGIARDNTRNAESSDLQASLKILDSLKERLISGEIVGITGVLIAPDDATFSFIVRTRPVSRLRMTGGLAWVLHMFMRQTEGLEGAPKE